MIVQIRRDIANVDYTLKVKRDTLSGVVEGFNKKAKLTMRKPYSFKKFKMIETERFHQFGHLPEPESPNRFG